MGLVSMEKEKELKEQSSRLKDVKVGAMAAGAGKVLTGTIRGNSP